MGRARWEFLRCLIFVNTEDARSGRVQGLSQGSRVVLHRRSAAAVGVKEWRQETAGRVKARDSNGPINFSVAATIALDTAFPKNQNQATEIRVTIHGESTRNYQ